MYDNIISFTSSLTSEVVSQMVPLMGTPFVTDVGIDIDRYVYLSLDMHIYLSICLHGGPSHLASGLD